MAQYWCRYCHVYKEQQSALCFVLTPLIPTVVIVLNSLPAVTTAMSERCDMSSGLSQPGVHMRVPRKLARTELRAETPGIVTVNS